MRFQIRQANVNRPSRFAAHRRPMAAVTIGAVDQQTVNAGGAHLGEGDPLAGDGGHEALKRGQRRSATKAGSRMGIR